MQWSKLLRESLLWRILLRLRVLLGRLPPSRLLGSFRSSALSERLCRRMERTGQTEQSAFFRFLQRGNTALLTFGERLRPIWRESRTAGVISRFRQRAAQSVFLGWTAEGGTVTFLLGCLAVFPILESLFKFIFQINILNNSWNEILLTIGFLTVICQRIRSDTPLTPCLTPAAFFLMQFPVIGLGLLCKVTLFPQIGWAGYYITMGGLLWFFVVTRLLRGTEDLLFFCRLCVTVAAGLSVIGILEYLFAIPIPRGWLETAETSIRTRAFAVFANPNQLGEYLELMLPMTVGMLYLTRDRKEKLRYGVCAVLMLAAALFTMSRGAWIAIAAGLFVFALLEDRRLVVLFLFLGACALMLPFVSARLTFIFSNDFVYSAAKGGRVLRWQTALRYLRQGNPLMGLGFGMYGGEIANSHQIIEDWTYYWVDNYYVKLLAENGVIGLASFVLMQVGLLYSGLRAWARVRNTRYRALTAGLLAGLVGILVHGMFECMLDVKFVSTLYWTFAALMLWLGFLRERRPVKQECMTAVLLPSV